MLVANGENVKVVQELMCHARSTLEVYSQAKNHRKKSWPKLSSRVQIGSFKHEMHSRVAEEVLIRLIRWIAEARP
jgi:hypothetical protein